ncbi:MAG: hypothetical protein P4L51_27625 [Puia sp.]|nr:hypothetical protein [Puia sp.]
MKTVLKIGMMATLLAGYSLTLNAQSTAPQSGGKQEIRLSVGPDAGLPLGNFSNAYDWSIGGSVQADFPVVKNLFVTVNAGYDNFFAKSGKTDLAANDIRLIPVKAGLKYFVAGNFYVQGQAGVTFLANKSELDANKSAAFAYAPQVGYLLKLAPKNYLDLGFRFEGNSAFYDGGDSYNFLGLRVAYSFGL